MVRCGELKPIDDFAWRRRARGQRDNFCRPCRSAYGKEHYAANRQRYVDQARVRKRALARERTALLIEYFKSHVCVDCGERILSCSSSTISATSRLTWAQALPYRSWESILAEIAKCEVVCANCHRRRTGRRRGSLRALLTSHES